MVQETQIEELLIEGGRPFLYSILESDYEEG